MHKFQMVVTVAALAMLAFGSTYSKGRISDVHSADGIPGNCCGFKMCAEPCYPVDGGSGEVISGSAAQTCTGSSEWYDSGKTCLLDTDDPNNYTACGIYRQWTGPNCTGSHSDVPNEVRGCSPGADGCGQPV
jgi:hypothetical protein